MCQVAPSAGPRTSTGAPSGPSKRYCSGGCSRSSRSSYPSNGSYVVAAWSVVSLIASRYRVKAGVGSPAPEAVLEVNSGHHVHPGGVVVRQIHHDVVVGLVAGLLQPDPGPRPGGGEGPTGPLGLAGCDRVPAAAQCRAAGAELGQEGVQAARAGGELHVEHAGV